MSERLPAIFFGHGNPLNALQQNDYTRGWAAMGQSFARPAAILCVSAHWYLPQTAVTAMESPRTIHDFGGFPRELYEFQYPARGHPDLAARVQKLLSPIPVTLDQSWGLDHGTWSVLCHLFPKADVPVIQLSIDETRPPDFHFEMGSRLASLRDEGILIVGSGNIIHNLHTYAWGRRDVEPFDWAVRFEARAKELMRNRTEQLLVSYESLGRDAILSAPTPDHYLPLLYVLATRQPEDALSFPVSGFDGGSVSMLCVQLG